MKGFMYAFLSISGLVSILFQWPQGGEIFNQHYLEAREMAMQNNKSLFLFFITDNCTKCNDQRKMIENDQELTKLIEEKYETAIVNVDDFDGNAIRQLYEVNDSPGYLVVQQDGQIIWHHEGHLSKSDLIKLIGSKTTGYLPMGSTDVAATPSPGSEIKEYSFSPAKQESAKTDHLPTETLSTRNKFPVFQIQFGFFGSKSNASNVLKKLTESGQTECYIQEETRNGKSYYRVLSPLYSIQSDAQMILHQTNAKGLEGTIKKIQ